MSSTINASVDGIVLTASSTAAMNLATGGTNRLSIDTSGNVGIATGNLTFSSTGQRITFDMSGAISNRLMFQTSTTNSASRVGVIPNGTSAISEFGCYNSSSPDNASLLAIKARGSDVQIDSTTSGTGTAQPLTFAISGGERMRLDTSGNLGIGTTPSYRLHVAATAPTNSILAYLTNSQGGSTRSRVALQDASTTFAPDLGSVGNNITFDTVGAERMRIDSSGNVGIGTATNNVFDGVAAARPLLVQSSSSTTSVGSSTNAITICNSDTTTNNVSQLNFAAITGASANQYSSAWIAAIHGARVNGQYPTGQLVFATSSATNSAPSEKMRIDSSGNVGIGTASPSHKLHVVASTSTGTTGIRVDGQFGSGYFGTWSNYPAMLYDSSGLKPIVAYDTNNHLIQFFVNNSERMRIIGDDLLFGCTSSPSSSVVGIRIAKAATQGYGMSSVSGTGTLEHWYYYNPNGLVGTISTNGSATSYNTSSDRRLKENISTADDAGELVDSIQIVKHDWKVGGHTRYGVIAQDLYEIVPEAVAKGDEGDEIEKTWGVDYSKLVPILVKEIQSLRARVAELETK